MFGQPYVPSFDGPFVSVLPAQLTPSRVVSGNGSPEGVMPGVQGQIYEDITNQDLWIKMLGNQMIGWQKFGKFAAGGGGGGGNEQQLYAFNGNPNGNVLVNTTKPCLCIDTVNQIVWRKTDQTISNTGWF